MSYQPPPPPYGASFPPPTGGVPHHGTPPPIKKKSKLPWIIGGAALLVLCCGGVVAAALPGDDKPATDTGTAQTADTSAKPAVEKAVVYGTCADAEKAGALPLRSGDPGYSRALDLDEDGEACKAANPAPIKTTAAKPKPAHKAITARQWALIAKDPDAHQGERIIVHGVVRQFDTATGTGALRADVGGVRKFPEYGFVDYDTNTMLNGSPSALADVVQDDLITVKATVSGSMSYETMMGGGNTVPLLSIDSLKVTGSVAD